MPRNAVSGTCSRTKTGGYVAGDPILSSEVNAEVDDIITMMTDSASRSGKGAMLANLAMGGFKITGMGAATANGQAVEYAQFIAATSTPAFASGTRLLFPQPSPPTGWTQITTTEANDRMLRVVNVTGGTTGSGGTGGYGYGGSASPILMNVVPSHSHTFSGNTTTDGAHVHNVSDNNGGTLIFPLSNLGDSSFAGNHQTGSAGAHAHSYSGTTATNGSASNWTPSYLNLILCSKT